MKSLKPTISIVALILIGLTTTIQAQSRINDLKPTLILISIDGFRADYLTQYAHPTLDALAEEGVRAKWMTPSYPSLTFPNHYAIATGLYPEHNGIVSNDMYDPVFNASFALGKRDEVQNGRWWAGEPIWITAVKQGQKASATFWPGSEAEIKGHRPTYWKKYDDKVPPSDRVDSVLSLLDQPADQRPTFLTLYFSDVDHAGHDNSPNSPKVGEAIAVVDTAIARLVSGLQARGIYQRVNIMVVSDHGMTPAPPREVIVLEDYFDAKSAQHIEWGAELTHIFPKAGDEIRLFRSIKLDQLDHVHCYLRKNVPARFHYRDNRRIGPIICRPDEGWRINSRKWYEDDLKKPELQTKVRGAHGYDNQLRSMRAIFIARGPAFKRRAIVNAFPNVDLYNVMTRVLRLKPARNDGSWRTARAVLRKKPETVNREP
ncbi:MAG TPA: ectonucleotide pyrophosphatase/phosphodiesterase [Pyrinomonadaceae bacterium]|nr:ectonucleotide pyrophosphatase/phosphodiesterase [Pyrinomonadaceae bacterium]